MLSQYEWKNLYNHKCLAHKIDSVYMALYYNDAKTL